MVSAEGDDHGGNSSFHVREMGRIVLIALTPQSRQELIVTFELMMFFLDIDPRGFKALLKGRLTSIDIFILNSTLK